MTFSVLSELISSDISIVIFRTAPLLYPKVSSMDPKKKKKKHIRSNRPHFQFLLLNTNSSLGAGSKTIKYEKKKEK